jgi:hypothetical protein
MQNPLSDMVGNVKSVADEAKSLGGEFKAKSEMVNNAKQALSSPPVPTAAPQPKGTMVYSKDKVNPGGKYGEKGGEKRLPVDKWLKGQMHDGGTVPEDGAYKMKKGEHVLTPEHKNHIKAALSMAEGALSHEKDEPDTPKKEVAEMRIRKGASGGHIVKHVHVHMHLHPDEEHVTHDTDGLMDHVMQHMTEPNEGEKEADAGDPGIEEMENAVGYKG